MGHVADGLKVPAAVALGAATAVAGLLFLLMALPFRANRQVGAMAVRLAGAEAGRVGAGELERFDAGRAMRYLAARAPVGLLGGIVVALLVIGLVTGVRITTLWGSGETFDGMTPTPFLVTYLLLAGVVLLFLDISGLVGVRGLERRIARRMLGPDPTAALRRRITELSDSRAASWPPSTPSAAASSATCTTAFSSAWSPCRC